MKIGNTTLRLAAVYDDGVRDELLRLYRSRFDLCVDLSRPEALAGFDGDGLLIDIDLADAAKVLALKEKVLGGTPHTFRIVMIEHGDRAHITQANGLGATDLLFRPFDLDEFHDCFSRRGLHRGAVLPVRAAETDWHSIAAAASALGALFSSLTHQGLIDMAEVNRASDEIVDAVAGAGIDRWLHGVRAHHVGTFQHCLLVTGVATNFAQSIGMRRDDVQRLTTAALLHDIGKARIPLEILNKTLPLDAEEFEVMKLHPVYGHDYLLTQPDMSVQVLYSVRHHHEYLDGSGYPDGLAGGSIDDLTRVLTVCDIYGALIEKRAYKKPRTSRDALDILESMARDGKVEKALVLALGQAMRETAAA